MKVLRNKIFLLVLIFVLGIINISKHTKSNVEDIINPNIEITKTEENIKVIDKHVVNIAKTIALVETNHSLNCNQIGESGEVGCYQFLPSTWRSYAIDVFGYVAKQTPENTKIVVETKVKEWKSEGLTDRQIFLIWNQGSAGQCRRGINKKGVKYDSCAYADRALQILKEL